MAQRLKRLKFAREHVHLSAQDWENYIFSDESTKYLFHVPNRQDDTVWGSQSDNVPDVSCVKASAKVMVWGAMPVNGLSNLHIAPKRKCHRVEFSQLSPFTIPCPNLLMPYLQCP